MQVTTIIRLRNCIPNQSESTLPNPDSEDPKHEQRQGQEQSAISITSQNSLMINDINNESCNLNNKEKFYNFDFVFDEKSTQREVYNTSIGEHISQVFSGNNLSLILFGGAKSGKSYTIYGGKGAPGVLALACSDLFTMIKVKDIYQKAEIR